MSVSSGTGAVRKKKIKIETPSESEKSAESSDSGDTLSDSSIGSSECSSSRSTKKQKKKKPIIKGKKKKETKIIRSARSSIELKRAPMMSSYNEESGIDLKTYLEDFENYCRQCFMGTSRFWIGELESKLSGNTLR